jgi:uncharacterized membrane protein YoaK (UPF0700 family)
MVGNDVPDDPLIRRIHRRVLIAGCGLAFGAAFANTGVYLRTGTSVSHLTGDISRLSIDLIRSSPEILSDLLRVVSATISFFVGAWLAGLVIHHPSLDFKRPYGRSITGIGGLFLLAHFILPSSPISSICLAAFACGLQNSLATRYRGVVLRTTHLTGLITDFGVHLGMRCKGLDVPSWKVAVPLLLIVSFFLGGACSAGLFIQATIDPILVAGIGYVFSGIAWTIAKRFRREDLR